MRQVRLILVAGLLSAFLLAACGDESSNELRSGEAETLRSTLSEVEQRVGSQDCAGAGEQVAVFRSEVEELPQRVDADLRQALRASADRLETLVADQCAAEPAAPTETTPEAGTTSPDTGQGNEQDQQGQGNEDQRPKDENPNQDQTQTETQPDTGGTGEEVPGVGNQGDGGASPEG